MLLQLGNARANRSGSHHQRLMFAIPCRTCELKIRSVLSKYRRQIHRTTSEAIVYRANEQTPDSRFRQPDFWSRVASRKRTAAPQLIEKCRMIRDSVLDTELAERAIGQVHLHFTAD